jgi:hypothetical protein
MDTDRRALHDEPAAEAAGVGLSCERCPLSLVCLRKLK